MTLTNNRKRLQNSENLSSDDSFSEKSDLIADEVTAMVKSAIYSLLQKEDIR